MQHNYSHECTGKRNQQTKDKKLQRFNQHNYSQENTGTIKKRNCTEQQNHSQEKTTNKQEKNCTDATQLFTGKSIKQNYLQENTGKRCNTIIHRKHGKIGVQELFTEKQPTN